MSELKYAYYPGCASQEITSESDETTRIVADALGIVLHDMPAASCCGAGLMTDYDRVLALAVNARIFAQAERMGMDIMTICSTCLMVMNTAKLEMASDPALRDKVNKVLASAGIEYEGKVKITHLLWVLIDEYGLEKLKKKVTVPLAGLKVGPFYGCHSLRPSEALGFDDPEAPRSLDDVIETLGADPIQYDGKTKCCGFQVDLVAEESALEMTGIRLLDAKASGAECIVTPCPFCHINLDNYQSMAEKKLGKKIEMPVFHLAQLVALAMGVDKGKLGLSRHLVRFEKLLK